MALLQLCACSDRREVPGSLVPEAALWLRDVTGCDARWEWYERDVVRGGKRETGAAWAWDGETWDLAALGGVIETWRVWWGWTGAL